MGRYYYKSNAALVIYTGAERGSEESTCCRRSKSNNSDLFLSGGYCGEDEFLSAKTIKKKSHRYRSCGILCLCEFIIVLGQLNAYVGYYKKNEMIEGDNPPVGILLCTDKGSQMVEYALSGMDNQLFVSTYMLHLPDKKKLEEFMLKEIEEMGM